jgi:hypothetical protein
MEEGEVLADTDTGEDSDSIEFVSCTLNKHMGEKFPKTTSSHFCWIQIFFIFKQNNRTYFFF